MDRKLARTGCDRIGINFLQCPRRDLIFLQYYEWSSLSDRIPRRSLSRSRTIN